MNDNLREKYEKKIQQQFQDTIKADELKEKQTLSSEYLQFREENKQAAHSFYEKACNTAEKILKIEADKAKAEQIKLDLEAAHLEATPAGTTSFAILSVIIFILVGSIGVYLFTASLFAVLLIALVGLALLIPLLNAPAYIAQNVRMHASNQMILAVFYLVTYMRHTSNLERAIQFASNHLAPPISLDLKKVIWDVETRKFDRVEDSLEYYLSKWKEYNPEFVESIHVVVSSLYESSNEKRQALLDKALDLILDETYDKMLHYAHNLQSPINALHMLGIVLPILGLIILPMVVNFMPDTVHWQYIALLYNIILPIVIYAFGKNILSKRPSGYGSMDINETNPEYKRLSKSVLTINKKEYPVNMKWICIALGIFFLLVGFLPIILHVIGANDIGFGREIQSSPCGQVHCLLGYKTTDAGPLGPFGLGATILSLFVPFGIAFSVGLYYYIKSNRVIKFRDETKKLENEFTGALFQLGNRLGDGLPPEIAFERIAQEMPDSRSGAFFRIISNNIRKLGMGVEDAIFHSKVGAIVYYPSNLIESSMKILTQSAQKGPKVASNAIENVARYIKEMNRVNERLQDLMAEVIASMKSQINFLTPIISAIVIGLGSMMTSILSQLSGSLDELNLDSSQGASIAANITEMFGDGIPTFYLQIIVGIYVVQVIFLLTVLINSIQNGVDKINENNLLAKNLLKSVGLYLLTSAAVILGFNFLAASVLQSAFG